MAYFSQEEIRGNCFNAVLDNGRRISDQKRVGAINFVGSDIIATVRGELPYRVVISRENRTLHFRCNCGFNQAGACEHAVAVMLSANAHAAIQIGINWDALPGDDEDPQTDAGEPVEVPVPAGSADTDNDDSIEATVIIDESSIDDQVEITEISPEKPQVRLYLSEQDGRLLVEVRFAYYRGNVEFSRADTASYRLLPDDQGRIVRVNRSKVRETTLTATLASADLMQYQTGFYTPSIDPRSWTLQQLPQLARDGYEIYGQEKLLATQARKTTPRLSVVIKSEEKALNCTITVSFDGIPATLAALVLAVRRRSRFVLLTDGSSGMLPEKWLDTFAALFGAMEDEPSVNPVRMERQHIGLAETLFDMADERRCDAAFNVGMQRLQSFTGVESQTLPAGLTATLRHYQQAGFEWFYFLREYGFGGCLADDMGLGKTIQTISLLLKEKERGADRLSLVVVPNSLLFNWQREVKKFAPSLTLLTWHGSGRQNYRSLLDMADVLLTTYGTVIRDCDDLRGIGFHYIILDEAQAIKNPSSQIGKAVRSLDGRYHLALSGTPIENNLSELWSLFAFLNPGLLGSYRMFLQNFIKPIEREMNEVTMEVLRKMVFPFILRRTKAQVVEELPPKNEMVVYAEMVPPQRTLYDITRQLYYGKIMESIGSAGIEGTRMQVLEGLLRLRQICSHPHLYDQTYNDDSGKFQLVDDMLQDAVAEGHRVLVFSQFVTSLELLRSRFLGLGIQSEMLTGATRDRQKVVDRFQEQGSAPVFLISLKAGGTGLNLTAADYVFHIDPWWNPSAENQASDRAYRIGQTRSVFVYKFITRDSIEERVLELQERKKQLMSSIIQCEETFFKHLTKDDVVSLFS